MDKYSQEMAMMLGKIQAILFFETPLKQTPKQRIENAREAFEEYHEKVGMEFKYSKNKKG